MSAGLYRGAPIGSATFDRMGEQHYNAPPPRNAAGGASRGRKTITPPIPRTVRAAVTGAAVAVATAFLAVSAHAGVAAAGDEVVHSGGPSSRLYSPSAAFGTGEAVLVWEGSVDGVGRQRVTAGGVAVSSAAGLAENDLPTSTTYQGPIVLQRDPAVVALEKNRIVSVWVEEHQRVTVDPFYQNSEVVASRIMARRFDHQARPIGALYALGADGPAEGALESAPAAVRLTNGRVAVVWRTTKDDNPTGIYGRLLNGRGRPIGDVFRVDDGIEDAGGQPAIAPTAGGGFLVVWQGSWWGDETFDVFVRAFDSTAAPAGAGFRINSVSAGNQIWPAVARGANGGYLAAWMTPGTPGSGLSYEVAGRPLDDEGRPAGAQVTLSSGDATAHGAPTLAASPEGFVVAWTTWRGSYTSGVLAAEVSSHGLPLGEAIEVSPQGVIGTQWQLALAADGKGGFLAAWQGFDPDGHPSIHARPLTTEESGSRSAPMAPPR